MDSHLEKRVKRFESWDKAKRQTSNAQTPSPPSLKERNRKQLVKSYLHLHLPLRGLGDPAWKYWPGEFPLGRFKGGEIKRDIGRGDGSRKEILGGKGKGKGGILYEGRWREGVIGDLEVWEHRKGSLGC